MTLIDVVSVPLDVLNPIVLNDRTSTDRFERLLNKGVPGRSSIPPRINNELFLVTNISNVSVTLSRFRFKSVTES